MTLASLRRAGILSIGAALVVFTLTSLVSNLLHAHSQHALAAEARLSAEALLARRIALSHDVVQLQAHRDSRSMLAQDRADASRSFQSDIQNLFQSGVLLNLNVAASEDGQLSARLIWRGSEAEMRTAFEHLAREHFAIGIVRAAVRPVEISGNLQVELDAEFSHQWLVRQ